MPAQPRNRKTTKPRNHETAKEHATKKKTPIRRGAAKPPAEQTRSDLVCSPGGFVAPEDRPATPAGRVESHVSWFRGFAFRGFVFRGFVFRGFVFRGFAPSCLRGTAGGT
jgi:hypothetical protein